MAARAGGAVGRCRRGHGGAGKRGHGGAAKRGGRGRRGHGGAGKHGGGGGRQFPVGRRRYAPVVDAGCGCRPRRPRLLKLPSFLKPCSKLMTGGGNKAATVRQSGEQYSCASTSTASFSSSAATHSTGGYTSAYSSDYYYSYPSHVVYGACTAKQHQELPLSSVRKQQQAALAAAPASPSPAHVPAAVGKKQDKKKTTEFQRWLRRAPMVAREGVRAVAGGEKS